MITLIGLSMAMLSSRSTAAVLPRTTAVQGDLLDKIIPSIDVKDADVRVVLEKLFKGVGVKMWVSPEIDLVGKITLKLQNSKFELVLQNIIAQVGFTYRYEKGAFLIVPREMNGGDPGPDEPMPEFVPMGWTSRQVVPNSALFVSPKRTKNGTYQLLVEAVRCIGTWSESTWSFGESGFAVSLPFEAIDAVGKPEVGNRFEYDMRYLPKFGFQKLSDLFASGYGNRDHDYRVIVLAATTDSVIRPFKLQREMGNPGLPYRFGETRWKGSPTLTAYVYEFRRQNGASLATLLKPGQSKISARQHLVRSGLWTEKELGMQKLRTRIKVKREWTPVFQSDRIGKDW